MTAPSLRPARSTDAGKVGAILSGFVDATPWMPRLHSRAEDVSFAGQMIDRGWVTVALQGAEVAGFLAQNGDDIHALYIKPSAQRQGCGRALLHHAQGLRDRLTLWTFQANTGAQAFYAAHGFHEVARTDGAENDEGLPDIQMQWQKEPA
ncbi:MAG: GNAT family N-acetyltransferase [Pseudomonadota bacterium]